MKLRFLAESGLDAIKIDVKGDSETYKRHCGGVRGDEVVWRNAKEAKRLSLHVEIVNLIVTGVNDDEATLRQLVKRHINEVGVETPIHFTRYYPAYRFNKPITKVESLELAYRLAKSEGILFPYVGNVNGHPYTNTYCPQCNTMLIRRDDWRLKGYNLTDDDRCSSCHFVIPMAGKHAHKCLRSVLWT